MLTQTETTEIKTTYTLNSVYLYFSGYCNLKCRHCWIDPKFSSEKNPKSGELDVKSLICALDECLELGMNLVKITGGEPFLREDIFELLDYIKNKKLNLVVETNGTLIKEKEASALKEANAGQVAVSLDGSTQELHQLLRGIKGSFDEAVAGIKFLKKENLNVQVIISLWRENKDYIKQTIDFARGLGANSVKINVINTIARADKLLQENEVLSVREVIDFYHQLMGDLKNISDFRIDFDIPPVFLPIENGKLKDFCTCGIFGILGILGDGRISICGIGTSSKTLVLGKVGVDSIKEIWNNHPILEEIRRDVPKNLTGVCSKCILKYYCLGKCRAEAFYTKGSLSSPIPFCQIAYEEGLFPKSRLIN